MGWAFQEKPQDVRRWFFDRFSWDSDTETYRCLQISLKLNACYAAVEKVQRSDSKREVFCAVSLIKYIPGERDRFNFGTKDMADSWGPTVAECPKHILDLLTDTDNECAIEWRARCRENLRKRMPKAGVRVRFENPIQFTDGSEVREFTVVRVGKRRKVLRDEYGLHYRISRSMWRDREWAIVG